MTDRHFTETETFKKARRLTNRTEIAKAFNLENRIALKITMDSDEYGDRGNKVKMAYNNRGDIAYVELEVMRFSDQDKIGLYKTSGMCCIKADFSLYDVQKMYEKQNLVTVKDGDKCVILVENKAGDKGFVLTGTIRLPKYKIGYQYSGEIELD